MKPTRSKLRKTQSNEQTEALPQNGGGWFMHVKDFQVTVDDNDDIGCTFYADSREDVRNVVKKVRKLPNIIVPGISKIKWSPELLTLGFKCWNQWDE